MPIGVRDSTKCGAPGHADSASARDTGRTFALGAKVRLSAKSRAVDSKKPRLNASTPCLRNGTLIVVASFDGAESGEHGARGVVVAGKCYGLRTALLVRLSLLIGGFAYGVLQFACVLFDVTGDLLADVASNFADHFLDRAFYFVFGTFSAILVHACSPMGRLPSADNALSSRCLVAKS